MAVSSSTMMTMAHVWRYMRRVAAVIVAVLTSLLRPDQWRRTIVDVLLQQIYFGGVTAVRFILLMALLVGVSVVVQAQVWLHNVGQRALLAPLLVAIVVRELGPFLVNFVVIGRSGSAISVELANMTVSGQIGVLEAQGVDPFTYLVVPRVLGLMISVVCLTVVFLVTCLSCGYVCGVIVGAAPGPPGQFLDDLLRALSPLDVINIAAGAIMPAMLTGVICCVQGMSVAPSINDVPRVTARAINHSTAMLFVTSVVISLLFYL